MPDKPLINDALGFAKTPRTSTGGGGSNKIKDIPTIYPETFFNIPHPDSPWVSIQFRTDALDDITDPDQWEEITINPSNFFEGITIEDESGFQKVEVNLVDKYFTKLETLITKAITVVNLKNKLAGNDVSPETKNQFFQYSMQPSTGVNMRVRFGYGNPDVDNTFIDETTFEGSYANRTADESTRTVIRSPWIYLQILNVVFKLTEFGLAATITTISTAENWLTKAKMLRRFYQYVAVPEEMMKALAVQVKNLSNGQITVTYEKPEDVKNEDGSKTITILLGSEVDEKNARTAPNFRTVQAFVDELCSKIPAKVYKSDLTQSTEESASANAAEQDRISKYSYMLAPVGRGKWELRFYYPDPLNKTQARMRTYVWREYGQSIVKSLEIDSQVDFAALNYSLVVINKSTQNNSPEMYLASAVPAADDKSGSKLVKPTDITGALSKLDMSFVSDVRNASGKPQGMAGLVAQQIVHQLNQGVFSGTLTLPGDPFYLFDNKVRPYEYMVKVIVLRPGFLDEDGNYSTKGEGNEQSYLSGYYLLKKISHKIDGNGFTTTLSIGRYPMKEDQ
jgi:hypothetical protein